MNRRSSIRLLGQILAATGAGSFLSRLSADNPKSNSVLPEQDFTIHSDVRLVLLDVSVQDKEAGFVEGLSKDNFRVVEDGRQQTVTIFDANDLPVTIGILVDESRSMTPKRNEVLNAAATFVQESNPLDEVCVLNFNDDVKPGLPSDKPFSSDIDELRQALYKGVPQGRTALYDSIVAGLRQLEIGQQSRKSLVLISDGGDNSSSHNRREVVHMVERSTATIYTIGLFDTDDPDRNPGILRELARMSGGEAFFPSSPAETEPVCRRIAKEIRTRYTIGYRPSEKSGSGIIRHIRVQATSPGHDHLIVRTRDSYRYESIAA